MNEKGESTEETVPVGASGGRDGAVHAAHGCIRSRRKDVDARARGEKPGSPEWVPGVDWEIRESTAPEPPAPESTAPESTTPEPTAPEPTAPEPTGPEPTAPGPTEPGATGPEPETSATPDQPSTPEESVIPKDPSSPDQEDAVKQEARYVDWIDRLKLPEYARTMYGIMSGAESIFTDENSFILPTEQPGGALSNVDLIEAVEFSMRDAYAGETGIRSTIFENEKFYTVAADAADSAIDYSALKQGDVVRTANFNGLYVTKIPKNDYDAQKKETCEYVAATYHAFDMDCPEVFWLSGKCKVRIMTVTDPATKDKEAYFFLVLADKNGFTMRSPAWTADGSIASGIRRRDDAVKAILDAVTSGDVSGQVRQLNRWLTEHNQYNTTPDLTTIGNEPHECLAALEGRIGRDGPVCDGYSRAMKVLCDKLGIPAYWRLAMQRRARAAPRRSICGTSSRWETPGTARTSHGTTPP